MYKRYKYLSFEDRVLIQTQLQLRFKPAARAVDLNIPHSRISQRLARNGWHSPPKVRSVGRPLLTDEYQSNQAHSRTMHCQSHRASEASSKLSPLCGSRDLTACEVAEQLVPSQGEDDSSRVRAMARKLARWPSAPRYLSLWSSPIALQWLTLYKVSARFSIALIHRASLNDR
jgi:hypothetical protein